MMKSTALLGVQAYLAGLTFALAASPCSTPVLATLLGYVAASRVNNVLSLSLSNSVTPSLPLPLLFVTYRCRPTGYANFYLFTWF